MKLAEHRQTKKEVAVKTIIKKNMIQQEVYQVKLEIEVLKVCNHPGIVKLLDLFEDQETWYIVLELVTGGDLFEYCL